LHIGNAGRAGTHRKHRALLGIDADVRFGAESRNMKSIDLFRQERNSCAGGLLLKTGKGSSSEIPQPKW